MRCCRRLYAVILYSFIASLTLVAHPVAANDAQTDYTQERLTFWEAKKALERGDLRNFHTLTNQLDDYPLTSYLHFDYLRTRLSSVADSEIENFLETYADSPLSNRLRAAWLHTLAQARRWDTYLQIYKPYTGEQGVALQCYALQARLHTSGQSKPDPEWLDEAEALWLVGRSQPDECSPVFKVWRAHGRQTAELTWQRIRLAMEGRQLSLADYLSKDLDGAPQQWAKRWVRMHKSPEEMLQNPDYQKDVPEAREIIRYGIKRVARSDAAGAAAEWQRLKPAYTFSAEEIAGTDKELAMAAALEKLPEAAAWLEAVVPSQTDERVRQWRVRVALADQDWQAVLKWIDALEPAEREKDIWRYWRARALEQLAQKDPFKNGAGQAIPPAEAEQIYTELAGKNRNYYGYLSADRLGKSYVIKSYPIEFSDEELSALTARPGMVRALELYDIGLITDARREWDYLLGSLSQREMQIAAVLAHRLNWHDRAILTAAKSDHMDDLDLRFPMLFRDQVLSSAQQQDLDPAWVYGVMRQESAFMPDARSSAGALGLMQLMPETGKRTAKMLNAPLRSVSELLDVDRNIQLGSAYLRHVLDGNGGDYVLATASYNAGPARVRQWLPAQPLPADIWVDNVPFGETRNYIQQVMTYTTIFTQRLGRDVLALRKRMQDIGAESE